MKINYLFKNKKMFQFGFRPDRKILIQGDFLILSITFTYHSIYNNY